MTLLKASGCITAIYLSYRYNPIMRSAVPISVPYFNHYSYIRVSIIGVISRHHLVGSQPKSRLINKQNDTHASFQCRSTKEENLAETKPMKPGSDSGLGVALMFMWLLFFLLFWRPIKGAFSNISKFIPKWAFVVSLLLISMVMLAPGSKKKEPRNVSFDDLVGVNAAKVELQEISSILQGKTEYKRLGAELPNGVLLYGPPGTGKTTLVHALAREAKASFFPVSARDITKVGIGAGGIKSLFIEARMYSPSIVFIKDVDAVVEQKGNREHDSPLFELYSEMEKCNNDRSAVVVIAATNTLETALMSFGRFWKKVHVGKPDKDGTRKIVGLHLKKVLREEDKEAICNFVASQTQGLVWADLKNIADEATRLAARRGDNYVTVDVVCQALRTINDDKGEALIQEHMQHSVESVTFGSLN